jgi:hypothetical protein
MKIPKLKLIRAYELHQATDMNWYEIARAIGGIKANALKREIERVEKEGLNDEI